MQKTTIDSAKTDISAALEETYALKGPSFEKQLKQARKYLPYKLTKDAEYLITAEKQMQHPKFRRFVDHKRVEAVRDSILRRTKGVDLKKDRSKARFSWGVSIILQLALVILLGVLFARWVGAY